MKQKLLMLCLILGAGLALTASSAGADFVQCVGAGTCEGTEVGDIINGTQDANNIYGMDGDDSVFAGDNPSQAPAKVIANQVDGPFVFGVHRFIPFGFADRIFGGPGDDFLSGGPGQDFLLGEEGNDHLLPGPDVPNFGQIIEGGSGNDTTYVFASEIAACLVIFGDTGNDTVNLIGFGPYSATSDFGLTPGFGSGYIQVIDPIAGGAIFIYLEEGNDIGTELINGLLSPSVTFVTIGEFNNFVDESNCILPDF